MKVSYSTKNWQEICMKQAIGVRMLGAPAAKKLRTLLANFDAAERLGDVPPIGNPHPLKGDRLGQFAFSIDKAKRVVIISVDDPCPVTADGAIDWTAVESVKIVFIGDYHE